jgi:hypothetical protein
LFINRITLGSVHQCSIQHKQPPFFIIIFTNSQGNEEVNIMTTKILRLRFIIVSTINIYLLLYLQGADEKVPELSTNSSGLGSGRPLMVFPFVEAFFAGPVVTLNGTAVLKGLLAGFADPLKIASRGEGGIIDPGKLKGGMTFN